MCSKYSDQKNYALKQSAENWNQPEALIQTQGRGRKKLWRLPQHSLCQIIGTCLNLDELVKVAAKNCYKIPDNLSDYELHKHFVSVAMYKMPITIQLQKYLDKKYAKEIRLFKPLKIYDDLLECWTTLKNKGDIAGGFWAAMTNANCCNQLIELIFGDVHMYSHLQGGNEHTNKKNLEKSKLYLVQLQNWQQTQQKKSFEQQKADKKQIKQLLQTLNDQKLENKRLNVLLISIESLKIPPNKRTITAELNTNKQQLKKIKLMLINSNKAKQKLNHQLEDLTGQLTASQDCNQTLEQDLHFLEQGLSKIPCQQNIQCYADCNKNLAGKNILYVGGKTCLTPLYRELVTRFKGEFIHHDGGIEDNSHILPAKLGKADMVVCPEDCISHTAYWCVKRYCKKVKKPLWILPSAGLSSFSKMLESAVLPGNVKGVIQ